MTKLTDLCQGHGQSPWLDNLRRDWVRGGELARWIERGVRGVTSNPSIFQKAMSEGHAYDEQFAQLVGSGASATDAYWAMAKTDIAETLSLFAPLHETSGGGDGFVSLELAPDLAHETEGSAVAARRLHTELDAPNLLVKIPATAEGVPAVEQMIAEGRSINITLIFSLDRYAAVMEAYLAGLERCPGDLGRVHSVASFFISRVDTEGDRRLDALGTPAALALRGRAAVAQAKLAHREFR
nr:transaldolase [Acidimicrobiia bacterium]